jgi:outer membrane lipoprotein-sorting protein
MNMGTRVRKGLAGWAVAVSVAALMAAGLPAAGLAQQPAQVPKPAQPAAPPSNAAGVGSAWTADTKDTAHQSGQTLDQAQIDAIKKVDGYFNDLKSMQGRFIQTTSADKKQTRGKFFVKKPGLFRFAYAPPSKLVILSDGNMLAIEDHDLKQIDKYPLDSTPFRLLLRKDVNLVRDARITDLQVAEDLMIVSIIDKGGDSSGAIKLFFAQKPAFELKEWVITDAQGVETRIEVADLDKTQPIDAKLFEPTLFGPAVTTGN